MQAEGEEPPVWQLCEGDDVTAWLLNERSARYEKMSRVFFSLLIVEPIIFPRQARNQHRKT